ncbi:hypothetical protein JCM3770_001324 [Rhodotorula araucariae]
MPLARPVSSADVRALSSGALPAAPAPPGRTAGAAALGLKLAVERNAYVAGQQVKGVLELTVKGQLALGEVGIEFAGVEELRSRDHTSTRRLLSKRTDFQGNGLPPSNAVKPGIKPIQSSFYPALPGRTRFPFAFTIPASMPSTCALGSNATNRYELRAFASSLVDGSIDLRSEKLEVRIVERWGDWREAEWQTGVERKAAERLALGGDGKLELVASVGLGEWVERPARLFWRSDADMDVAGKGKIEVRAKVRNLSKRHVTGLKLSLVRRLRILYPENARPLVEPPVVSTAVVTERFHGIDYDVRSGGERDVVLTLQVPREECWTVRKGTLFEIDVVLRAEVECGFLQKSLTVDLPIWVAHPLSLPNSAHRFADEERARLAPAPAPPAQPSIPYSPSTVGFSPLPHQALSPEPYGPIIAQGGHLPLPGTPAPGSHGRHYAGSAISMTSSVSSPAMYPSPSPAPYFPPPPAAPAELYDPVATACAPPQGYITFDPTVPDLSASRFLGSLQHQQSGQLPALSESVVPPAHAAHFAPLPLHSPYAAGAAPPPRPYSALSQHQARPPSRAYSIGAELHLAPHDAAQVEANLAPVEPYSGMQRSHPHAQTARDLPYLGQDGREAVRQHSTPPATGAAGTGELDLPSASPPRPCASPVPSVRSGAFDAASDPSVASSSSRTRVSHTPPPPSPSSHFRRELSPAPLPSPSLSPVESSFSQGLQPAESTLLETIGEDGESQAGTARSAMLPTGMADALRDDGGSIERMPANPRRSSAQDLEDLVEREEWREEERKKRVRAEEEGHAVLAPLTSPASASLPSTAKDARPRAQDIFSHSAPPAPSPAPASPSYRGTPPRRGGGGLSALEARLARPTTPDLSALQLASRSRSPSPIKPLGSPASFARTVAVQGDSETVGSALRARSISRASKYAEEVRRAEEEDPREAVRRAREKAEWARSPLVRAVQAATGGLQEAKREDNAGWPSAPVEAGGRDEQRQRDVKVKQDERVEWDSSARPPTCMPPAPLNLSAPQVEPVTEKPSSLSSPSSPLSPRRPLPSPPASPRRALPPPPVHPPLLAKSQPASPTLIPFADPAPSSSPSRPVARPVFGSSPAKKDTLPAPPSDPPFIQSSPSRSPVKTVSPNPWTSRPSPWSLLAKPPSPCKISPAPNLTFDGHRSPVTTAVNDEGRKVLDATELKGLKRDAVDRIASWLKDGADATLPAEASSFAAPPVPIEPERITVESGRPGPEPPSSGSSASASARASVPGTAPSLSAAQCAHAEPTVAQLLAAETRAALREAQAQARQGELTRSSAVEKGLSGYLAALERDAEASKDEYAHKSAKKAAPGKVRSVASIWAERAEEADRERAASPPTPLLGHKPTKSLSSIQLGSLAPSALTPKPLASMGNAPATPRTRPLSLQARATSPPPTGARATPAKPFLNTTLGRAAASPHPAGVRAPAGAGAGRLVASESAPTGLSSAAGTGSRAGAKVKDLLARYQQQTA